MGKHVSEVNDAQFKETVLEAKTPVLTVSGTARLSEMGNPWFFRFFPGDGTVKVAHARYVAVEPQVGVEPRSQKKT